MCKNIEALPCWWSLSGNCRALPPINSKEFVLDLIMFATEQQISSKWKELAALSTFDGPPHRFLPALLAFQCRLTGAEGGVLLRRSERNRPEILAIYPPQGTGGACTDWIAAAEESSRNVLSEGQTLIVPENGAQPADDRSRRQIVILPVKDHQTVRAAAAFLIGAASPQALATCREQLELTTFLLNHYELRLTLNQRHSTIDRLRLILEVIAAVNRPERFTSAAMAFCNETASRTGCSRVSLGFLKGRCVQVRAISHTDGFSRETQLIQDIETTMEECLDQDVEVIYPTAEAASYSSRAAAQLSRNHGPAALLSLPLRRNGEVSGVLTLERPVERPFGTLDELEILRLACDLCAPRLFEKHEEDRWFGVRLVSLAHRRLGLLARPEQTGMKLAAVAAFLLAVFFIFARGDYRIEAPFVFEAPLRQVVVAPFDTYIRSVAVDPGDQVDAGRNILGVLDTSELRLELAALKAERLGHEKQMAAFMRDGRTAEAQIARAQSDKCTAQIRLLEQNMDKATLVAPITGRVVSEDLKRRIGAPVETGKVLFEVARIDALRAELFIPEESITSITVGQRGALASVGRPDQKILFFVERINPIAEVVNKKNVFRVRARLQEQFEWMRPGMEGIAKIEAGKKPYIWIGTRRIANWLRMKLWI